MSDVSIDWRYQGKTDLACGTGATVSERLIVWTTSYGSAIAFVAQWYLDALPWSPWQYALAALIAFDVVGGVVANATNSCKRFYHTPAIAEDTVLVRFLKFGIAFELLHVHTVFVGLLYPHQNVLVGLAWYVALLGAVVCLRYTLLYLKRPVSFLLISAAIIGNHYLLPMGTGFERLVPMLFLKLVCVRFPLYDPLMARAAVVKNSSL